MKNIKLIAQRDNEKDSVKVAKIFVQKMNMC